MNSLFAQPFCVHVTCRIFDTFIHRNTFISGVKNALCHQFVVLDGMNYGLYFNTFLHDIQIGSHIESYSKFKINYFPIKFEHKEGN